jgi:hypothetical protein
VSLTVNFSAATTPGDLLVVAFQLKNTKATPSLGTVKDSTGKALTKGNTLQVGQLDAGVFYEPDAPKATSSITITPAQKGDTIVATIYDVTGAATSPLDVTANANSCTGPTPQTPTAGPTSTTRSPYELVVGTLGWSQAPPFTFTPNTGYVPSPTVQATTSGEQEGEQSAYLQTSSLGPQTYSGTLGSSSGSPVCWTGVIATFTAATQIKPDIAGLLDRGATPGSAYGGSNFTPPLSLEMPNLSYDWAGVAVTGIVVNETWADLQPTAADQPIVEKQVNPSMGTCPTALPPGSNEIDLAMCDVGVWNSTYPNNPMYIKLRVWAGEDAPTWATQIGAGAPYVGTSGATIGAFWTSQYEADYDNLMRQLAGLYDTSPLLEDVEGSACMTEYDEPMLHADFKPGSIPAQALITGGYTDSLDYTCLKSDITSLQNWKETHVALSFNPWELLTPSLDQSFVTAYGCPIDPNTKYVASPCEQMTENFMDTFANTFRAQGALANHSIRYGENPGTGYASMYQHIVSDASFYGATVQYQTATMSNLQDTSPPIDCTSTCEGLSEALSWACGATDQYQTSSGQSASAVELPGVAGGQSPTYTNDVWTNPTNSVQYDNFTSPSSYASLPATYLSCIQKDPHG